MKTLLAPELPELYDKHIYEEFGIEVVYPETDGERMAESDFQRKPLIYFLYALQMFFDLRPDVYVSGDMLMFYEEGAPKKMVAPDVFVVKGVNAHDRSSYKVWEEGAVPSFVLEILSPSTAVRDQGDKFIIYKEMGVQEYVLFDPIGTLIQPRIQGFQLRGGEYHPLPVNKRDGALTLHCDQLGLELHLREDNEGRWFNPATQQYLPSYKEQIMLDDERYHEQLRRAEEAEREKAEAEREKTEAEQKNAELIARLRALGEDI